MLWFSTRRIRIWGQKVQKTPGSRYARALNEHNCVFLPLLATYSFMLPFVSKVTPSNDNSQIATCDLDVSKLYFGLWDHLGSHRASWAPY